MTRSEAMATAVFEKLREFDRVAGMLEMPAAERLGILNVSQEAYAGLKTGNSVAFQYVKPELERRLSYASPPSCAASPATAPSSASPPAPPPDSPKRTLINNPLFTFGKIVSLF